MTAAIKSKDPPLVKSYYRPDSVRAYKGLLNLKCMYCGLCSPIPFDMDLHLYEMHRDQILELFLHRRGLNRRINYLLYIMQQEAIKNERCFGSEHE